MTVALPKVVPPKEFTAAEHHTWKLLFENQTQNRRTMAVPEFARGIEILGMTADRIPDLNRINDKLYRLTGWRAIPVEGLEDGNSFYPMLARREYPIGWFIRDPKDLNYTPAPDVFHDLYGHMPFFVDPIYADFCEDIGRRAMRDEGSPQKLQAWERLFWFTIEFALLETPEGRRIFGGGILSSYAESIYALSEKPTVHEFSLEKVRDQDFRTDGFQPVMFLLRRREDLFSCLDPFEKVISRF